MNENLNIHLNEKNNQTKFSKLKNKCISCTKCPLSKTRNNVVFGKGNENADILFIGEAPGAKEDEIGLPFVGRAGKELDKLLHQINLSVEKVYIANILKCRPPKNRDPDKEEIKICTKYLVEQIKIIKPKIIATLGNYSTKFVLSGFDSENMKKIEGIKELHGNPIEIKIKKENFTVIPIYHPSAMMYRPSLREEFEKDFQKMKTFLEKTNQNY